MLLGAVWLPASGRTERFAAVQIAEMDERSAQKAQAEAARAGAELVVWPEFGGLGFAPNGDTRLLRQFSKPPFVTSFRDDAQPLPHNAAALFENGTESERYFKRKLFGGETQMHTA